MKAEGEEYLRDVESPTDLKRILTFEVPRERVEAEIEEIIRGIKKEISMPGFRKGKVPLDMVRAKFSETARKEAIEKLVPDAYKQALEKESLRPIMPAEISNMEYGEEGPLTFQVAVELFPKVEVKEYKGVKVKKTVRAVENADVDSELEKLRERFAKFEKLDREAQTGDIVVMDYWRLGADDKPIRGSRVTNYPAEIGGGNLVKEFDEQLPGMKKGDRKVIEVTYPEDFSQEELRGKTVKFEIDLKDVGRRVLPEVNEDFARMIGLESVEEIRAKIGEGLKSAHEQEADRKAKQDVLNSVIEQSTFEVPEGLVNMGLESMLKSYREEYQRAEAPEAEAKLAEIGDRLKPLAVNLVKEQFIVDDIANKENIIVEDGEIDEVIKSVAAQTGISVEETRKRAADSDEIGRWRRDLLKNKVLDFLLEHAEIEE
jgi:trigger factor